MRQAAHAAGFALDAELARHRDVRSRAAAEEKTMLSTMSAMEEELRAARPLYAHRVQAASAAIAAASDGGRRRYRRRRRGRIAAAAAKGRRRRRVASLARNDYSRARRRAFSRVGSWWLESITHTPGHTE